MGVVIADGKTAAALEAAAREKAWVDFLSHIRLSLEVWQIDPDVREHCEHVVSWLRRLGADLTALGDSRGAAEDHDRLAHSHPTHGRGDALDQVLTFEAKGSGR